MKTKTILPGAALIALFLCSAALSFAAVTDITQPKPARYEVGERGAHHRVMNKITTRTNELGAVEQSTNVAYVELATGLHYQDAKGQWQESKEEFTLVPGWAVARKGQHKVSLAYNLNTAGPIATELPDGRVMRSQVLSLHYVDKVTQQSVRLAEIKDCAGLVLGLNQILYTNAFDGVNADVRFNYTKSGIEQDIILRAQPPSPEMFGMNPDTTRLAVLTEFLNPPTPSVKREEVFSATGYTDKEMDDAEVDFGPMHIGRGKAFLIGTENDALLERKRTPVFKRWMELDGRHFLLESVPLEEVKQEIGKLPEQAGVGGAARTRTVTAGLDIPEASRAEPTLRNLEVAQVMKESPGYVIDYMQLNTSVSNYTFAGNMTYYINGTVNLYGSTTFEGGAVIKFPHITLSGGFLRVEGGSVDCKTGPYRPVVFTSSNDDSVGEIISGSTGSPSINHNDSYYLTFNGTSSVNLSNLRFCYGFCPLTIFSGSGVLSDLQFVRSDYPAWFVNSTLSMRNVLMQDVQATAFWLELISLSVEHLTVNGCVELGYNSGSGSMALTNSLLVGVQSLGGLPLTTNNVSIAATNPAVFQSVGAGHHYLAAGSAHRNVGTTNINATLLARLRTQTTYPPIVYSNVTLTADLVLAPQAQRDTDTPDLGYHYEPIDYITDYVIVTNAAITLTNGVSVACYNNGGLVLWNGTGITSHGTPAAPNWATRYNCVQEQSVKIGTSSGTSLYAYQSPLAAGNFQHTKFSAMAGAGGYHFYHANAWSFKNLIVRDCEIYGSFNQLIGITNTRVCFQNSLLHKTTFLASQTGGTNWLAFSNNLCVGSTLRFGSGASSNMWFIFNNAFDRCLFAPIATNQNTVNGYSAYINTTNRLKPLHPNDLVLTNFTYATGPLGNFYQPTNSALFNKGSTNAYTLGLFHYTTTTNQVKEMTSTVDLGYHYVSADSSTGAPLDSDWDGTPDYLDADSDGDSLADRWEIINFTNLTQTAAGDGDNDDLNNLQEFQLGTSPTKWDTDGDELSDSEELTIPVDVNHPEWGNLNPLKSRTGIANVTDGALDSDHDGLSNLGEVRNYLADATNAHTYSSGLNDAEYFHIARVEISGQPPLPPSQRAMARGLQVNLGGGLLQFSISEAFPGARYDLYFVNNLIAARWQWRRVFSGVECDANGDATFTLQQPDPFQGYFVILSAEDADADGLTDGYETWFTYNGQKTMVDVQDTDFDGMLDNWEVEYGLNPTPSGGVTDGPTGNPDGDGFLNKEEHDNYTFSFPSYDPLKVYNTAANRPVITIFNSTANPSCPVVSFTIYRFAGDGANYSSPLTVYYSVGGDIRYATDYTLSPAPTGLPRIYSAVISAGDQSVTVNATLVGNAVPSGSKKLVATITPYSVAPTTQVSDPLAWAYVVDWANNRAEMVFSFDNLRPVANDQSVTACPNADNTVTLTGYDVCNDPLTYVVLSSPTHGTLTGTAPNLIYHPALNYLGPDSFTFKVNDGLRDSVPATVSITVGQQPVANGQTVQTCRNEPRSITLTGSGNCGALTFSIVNAPTQGSLGTITPIDTTSASVTYTPNPSYCGQDNFTFRASNTGGNSDPANVTVEVGDPNPVANCRDVMTGKNMPVTFTLSGADICGDTLTFAVVPGSGPNNGTLSAISQIDANHASVTYTPGINFEGDDGFQFTVSNCRASQNSYVNLHVVPAPALMAECREDRIILRWTIPSWVEQAGLANSFEIYRCESVSGNCSPTILFATVAGGVRAFADTSVSANSTYCYKVRFTHTDACDAIFSYPSPVSTDACSSICPPPPPNCLVIRPGFDAEFLVRNDDNQGVNNLHATLPFSINYFGTTRGDLFVNNNGNVTFDSSLGQYTPDPLPALNRDIIAPFWADVDTRALASDVVRYGAGTVGGRSAFGVEWVDVGYYAVHSDKLLSVQLVLIDRSDTGVGNFDMEFNYCKVRWEAGDVSGGSGGFWLGPAGSSARAGFASAGGFTFEFTGSGGAGAFLDSNLNTGLRYHNFNSTDLGRYVFQFRSGQPLATP